MKHFIDVIIQKINKYADSLIVFASSFFLYAYTAPPSVFAGDSGDVTTAAALLGYAHPPGYPLYSLLGYVWIHVFQIGPIAWRMNIFSAIWASAALVVLYHLIKLITKNTIAAIIGALTLATSYAFWEFGMVAEVFSLHLFLSLLFLWGAVSFYYTRNQNYLYVSVLTFSLEIAHQHMIILWLPGVLYILIASKFWKVFTKKFILISLLLSFIGPLFYIYLPLSVTYIHNYYWGDPLSLRGFLDIFLRRQYGTFNIVAEGSSLQGIERLRYIPIYTLFTLFNFSIPGVVISIIGSVYLLLKKFHLTVGLLINFFVSGILFLIYAGLEIGGLFNLGAVEKFSLMSLSLIGLFIGIGIHRIFTLASDKFRPAFVLISFLLPLYLLISHWPTLNLRNYWEGWYLGRDTLAFIPPQSVMSFLGDSQVFNTRYVQMVEGFRKDDVLLATSPFEITYENVRKIIQKEDLDIPLDTSNPLLMNAFIEKTMSYYTFYTRGKIALPEDKVLIPEGMGMRLYAKNALPEKDVLLDKIDFFLANSFFLQHYDPDRKVPPYTSSIYNAYSFSLVQIGNYLFNEEHFDKAKELFTKALELNEHEINAQVGLSKVLRRQNDCKGALALMEGIESRYKDPGALPLFELSMIYSCLDDTEQAEVYKQKFEERQGEVGVKTDTEVTLDMEE